MWRQRDPRGEGRSVWLGMRQGSLTTQGACAEAKDTTASFGPWAQQELWSGWGKGRDTDAVILQGPAKASWWLIQAGARQEMLCESLPPRGLRPRPNRLAGTACQALLTSLCRLSHFLLLPLEIKQLLAAGKEMGAGHASRAQPGSWPGLPRLTHFPGCWRSKSEKRKRQSSAQHGPS